MFWKPTPSFVVLAPLLLFFVGSSLCGKAKRQTDNDVILPTRAHSAPPSRLSELTSQLTARPTDLVFVLDGTQSVRAKRFQQFVKAFAADFSSLFQLSSNRTRVAVVVFAGCQKVRTEVDFIRDTSFSLDEENDFSKCTLLEALEEIEFIGGQGSCLGKGLVNAERILMSGRSNARRLVILLTDGRPRGTESPTEVARRMRNIGTTIVAFGVGKGVPQNELDAIATHGHVYTLAKWEDLQSLMTAALREVMTGNSRLGPPLQYARDTRCSSLCATLSGQPCCDALAQCACVEETGKFSCVCQQGYDGNGISGNCTAVSVSAWLSCPSDMVIPTDRRSSTAIASWTIPAVDPSHNVTLNSTAKPPALLSVGKTEVRYMAVDKEGLTKAECSFIVEVIDTEPPILLSCPEDLIKATNTQTLQVSWDPPGFQDNTKMVSIATNSQEDGVLATLDAGMDVWYQATDAAGYSTYCNFTVALKPYQCPYTEPPLNGALVCENWLDGGTMCALACQEGYDFNQLPAAMYLCAEIAGTWEWQVLDTSKATLQNMTSLWPQCYQSSDGDRTPSRKSIHYYNGLCSSADARSKLRKKFLRLFRKLDKEVPGFCSNGCEVGGVLVACGLQNGNIGSPNENTERFKRDSDKRDRSGLLDKNPVQSLKASITSEVLISRLQEILLKDLDNSLKTSLVPYFETAIDTSPQPGLVCEEGHVQKGSVCLECPIGTYHTPAADECITCDYGQFQDETGEMSCKICPAGTNTTVVGARKANQCREPCRAGTFSPAGLQPCIACPHGTFAATEGSTSCQQCPDGKTTDGVGAQSTEECLSHSCEPGSFSMSGHQPCLPCAPGFYQPMSGQRACLPCPEDSSSQALGTSHVTTCRALVTCDERICHNNGTCVIRGDFEAFCKCVTGFMGTLCETNIDDCLDKGLCMHGGICRDRVAGYECVCLPGFNGTNCEVNVDECESGPCMHAGVCHDGINSYGCECLDGYNGTECDINIDECSSSPCQNGATCLDQVAAFNCSCLPGYEGKFCEVRINQCLNHPCANNGTCQDLNTGPHCTCAVGFTGKFCQDDINDCLPSPCKNNATCVDGVGKHSCMCGEGYTGTNCELFIDYCTSNPCENEGTCIRQSQGFRCDCKRRYRGVRCEKSTIERCSETTCQNGWDCIDLFHGPWCHCKTGFTGANCETDIDDCIGVTCLNGGHCTDHIGTYNCECQPGFTGTFCNLNIDECESVPCMNGATCLDGVNAFTCACAAGFSGMQCEDILDFCSPNPCQNGAVCINDPVEYRCQCQDGFTGKDCEVNIDDCVAAFCDNGGSCVDDVGSYWCKCAMGFQGSDCEINIDDCHNIFCENGGRCIDGINEAHCKCTRGFSGERCETNVDDCVSVQCSNGGSCIDDVDGFHCQCVIGFSGQFCQTNIQNCNDSTCQNGGTCLDGVNEFHCVCVEGFTSNHCEVDIDDCTGSPCMNEGQCIDNINSYTCLCTHDFTGTHCEFVIDNCMHTPCSNGGSCIDDIDSFHCDCMPGFTGMLCEFNIDDCWSRPCFNKGTCQDGINSYRCFCVQGYTGDNCELTSDNCKINACLNGATCVSEIDSYVCKCVEGYSGAYCQDKKDYCDPQPCLNNGICQDLEMGFKCLCPQGYGGNFCEFRVDPCLGYICLNRALCQDSADGPVCLCFPGFTGKHCQENIDDCIGMPCQNGGSCEDRLSGYECTCIEGFIGINCQIDIDECRSAPCENGATCADKINEYQCLCPEGFIGRHCEINIDDCSTNPCRNNGSCIDGVNDFRCQCQLGFTGDVCDVNIDDCLSVQCRNGGTCIDYVDGFLCLCLAGFNGTLCEIHIDNCVAVQCKNGGTCRDGVDKYHCQCASGFTGSTCEIDIDDCLGKPCLNDARCVDAVIAFTCECLPGFTGDLCGVDVDECRSSPCLNQAQCVDGVDRYSCICEEGFEGAHCEDNIDDCQDLPCQNGATCEDLINSFSCQCPAGFSGKLCQLDVDECSFDPCKNGGRCVDGVNYFSCLCPHGFTGSLCQIDIDDCTTSSCQNGGSCVDGIGTYSCTCAMGFTSNLCEANIDDCEPNPCEHGGQCIDGVDTFTCRCPPGFTGHQCESLVDNCYSHPCQNGAMCVDMTGDYLCDCIAGFTGKDCEVDVDECASDPCLNDGICHDDINSYMCECPDGFTGVMCEVNFDDCASGPCLNGAECQDLPRGFNCYCQDGYHGNRCQEQINPCDAHPCLNNGLCTLNNNSRDFHCECRRGYQGDFCEEDIDDCLGHMEECLNGAVCEDRVDGFFCRCAPGYAGEKCQLKLSLDFDLIFAPRQPTPNHIHVQPDLYELTLSLWVRPEDLIQKGSLVSYTVYREDDHLTAGDQGSMAVALSLRDYSNMIVQINDKTVEINFRPVREIDWHHIAFTWEGESGDWHFYYDGMLVRQGTGLQAGQHIPGGGLMTIGMEHEGIAQQKKPTRTFVGQISQVNMWQYAMSAAEIQGLYGSCDSMGDAMAWPQVLENGLMLQRRQPSQICRNIDDCTSSPCLNGATCHDLVHTYTCDCPDGYEGNKCQMVSANCMQDTCLNGGRCYDRPTGPACSCAQGFTGPRCEVAVNPCESLQCNYGGTCVVQGAMKAVCRCPAGYRGPQCNYDKNECSVISSGCSQRCVNTLGSYYCDCEAGFTLQQDGKTCVDARLCWQNGVIRQANEEWQENCQHCRCVEGIACTPMTCYDPVCPKGQKAVREPGYCCPVCSVEKDFCAVHAFGNFESFDLFKFRYRGHCRYTMAQDCSSGSFSIHIESEQKALVETSPSKAFKKSVFIYLNGDKIELSSAGVKVNSKLVNVPFHSVRHGMIHIDHLQDEDVKVTTNIGLDVIWRASGKVKVFVPRSFQRRLCGLCGNYNGKRKDDKLTKHQLPSRSAREFIHSWKVNGYEHCSLPATLPRPASLPSVLDNHLSACTRLTYHGWRGVLAKCDILKQDVFAECRRAVNPKSFYRLCQQDVCSCGSNEPCYCEAIAAYAQECRRNGIIVRDWRNSTICGIDCPETMIFDDCGPPCIETCYNTASLIKMCRRLPCVARCQCAAGFALHEGRCILKSTCPNQAQRVINVLG